MFFFCSHLFFSLGSRIPTFSFGFYFWVYVPLFIKYGRNSKYDYFQVSTQKVKLRFFFLRSLSIGSKSNQTWDITPILSCSISIFMSFFFSVYSCFSLLLFIFVCLFIIYDFGSYTQINFKYFQIWFKPKFCYLKKFDPHKVHSYIKPEN